MGRPIILDRVQEDIRNFGLAKTLHRDAFIALNRLVYFRVLKCVTIGEAMPPYLKIDDKFTCKFLDADMLFEFSADQTHQLSPSFIDRVLKKGDECYAILDGEKLAAYGWYSNRPTDISDNLSFHFSEDYIYMYNGYTHNEYRGQRLHAIGMTKALQAYLDRGFKGLVSYVESHNHSSLKSCYRMGYKNIGNIYLLNAFHHHFIHADGRCRAYEINVKKM